jgi:transposase InsO family protein
MIRGFLLRQGHQGIPAASTITQILRRRGLVDPTPAPPRDHQRFEAPFPNALWQMDFKGYLTLANGKRCHPFGALDDHSRYNVVLAASTDQRTPTVRELLSAAFRRYGLPDRILCDNGSPWGNTWDQPWTSLGVWLCDLGVVVSHGRPYHPQTQGKQERFHRTLDLEVLSTRPRWVGFDELQAAFDDFRVLYNHHRPHSALGETVVPADRYRPSERALPDVVPPVDYPDGTEVRKVDANARISFKGRIIRVGKAFRGRPIGVRSSATDGVYHLYYRSQLIRTVDLTEPTEV